MMQVKPSHFSSYPSPIYDELAHFTKLATQAVARQKQKKKTSKGLGLRSINFSSARTPVAIDKVTGLCGAVSATSSMATEALAFKEFEMKK